MKIYKSILLFFALLPCFYTALGQAKDGKIGAQIKDADNKPVTEVSINLLRSADSVLVKFTLPDGKGFFIFNDVAYGNYLISITGIGYKKIITKPYIVNSAAAVNVGVITIENLSGALGQIDIVAKKPFVEFKPGKTILNIQSSVLANGSNALDILERAGAKVDANDNLSLNGKQGVLVLIDGRQTYLPAEALVNLLQSTLSNTIDQIELVSNPGANYDAASAGGVINIKLKKTDSYGINGSLNVSAGITQISDGYGSKFNNSNGVNINIRSKNLNVFGSYTFSYLPTNRVLSSDRFISYQSILTEIKSNYFSSAAKSLNNYRIGADFNLSPKQIIGFLISGSTTSFILNKNTNTSIANQGVPDSSIVTVSKLNSKSSNIQYDLNYKIAFNKIGELSVDGLYSNYSRTPMEVINSNYYNSHNYPYRTLGIQNSYPSNYDIYTYNADYSVNLNTTSSLRATVKSNYVDANNNLDFGEIVGGQYHSDPKFTNQFNFTELVNAGAVIYNSALSKKVTVTMGLRVEQTVFDGKSSTQKPVKNNYTDFFPNATIGYKINADNEAMLSYSTNVTRPLYNDLNPFIAYQDQYSYYMGNPNLQPYYTKNFKFSNLYQGKLTTELGLHITNNFTQSIYIQNDTTKIVYTKKVNLGNRYSYRVALAYRFNIASWWNANCRLDASFDQYSSTPSQGSLNTNATDADLTSTQTFTLSKSLTVDVFGEYETPTTYGTRSYKSVYNFDAGITKVINKKTTLSLKATDIFNTRLDRYSSKYQNLNLTGSDQIHFRTILVVFSYRFGSKTVKAERTRKTGAETEQGRATVQQ